MSKSKFLAPADTGWRVVETWGVHGTGIVSHKVHPVVCWVERGGTIEPAFADAGRHKVYATSTHAETEFGHAYVLIGPGQEVPDTDVLRRAIRLRRRRDSDEEARQQAEYEATTEVEK